MGTPKLPVHDAAYRKALIEESIYLISELATLDKKIEGALKKDALQLSEWLGDGVTFVLGEGAEKVIEHALRLLMVSTAAAGPIAAAVIAPFSSTATRRSTPREAFLMANPELAVKERELKMRLAAIYAELALYQPPLAKRLVPPDRCEREACLRKGYR